MSVSIYCFARRPQPLSDDERRTVERIVAKYSVESRIRRFEATGQGIAWRPLQLRSGDELSYGDAILEAVAELPTESEEALATALAHWCNAASALRREIHKALWEVRAGDREIPWDYLHERYEPEKCAVG
jgi:hypothetical protein